MREQHNLISTTGGISRAASVVCAVPQMSRAPAAAAAVRGEQVAGERWAD